MYQKRKVPNFKERCRICLDRDACMQDLFSDTARNFLDTLRKSTDCKIDEAGVSRNVCHVCLYKIESYTDLLAKFKITNSKIGLYNGQTEETLDLLPNHQNTNQDDNISGDINSKKRKIDVSSVPIKEKSSKASNEELTSSSILDSSVNHGLMIVPEETRSPVLDSPVPITTVENLPDGDEVILNNGGLETPGKTSPIRKLSSKKEALTKRWQERKKALLAASGENLSDTDSSNDENLQLSPIRKARVMCNNSDSKLVPKTNSSNKKSPEITNHVLNNVLDSSSSSIKRQKSKPKGSTSNNKTAADTIEAIRKDWSDEKEEEIQKKSKENSVAPHLIESKIKIGNTIYIVSSILDEPGEENTDKDLPDQSGLARDTNTAIIDALELKRADIKKDLNPNVINCLKIEVEGMEFEALRQIQTDLEKYVTDLDYDKLFKNGNSENIMLNENPMNEPLDHQLKYIVKTVLQKNCDMDNKRPEKKKQPDVKQQQVQKPQKQQQPTPKILNNNIAEGIGLNKPGSARRKHILPKRYKDFELEQIQSEHKTSQLKLTKNTLEKEPINSEIVIINESENDMRSNDSECAMFDLTHAPKEVKVKEIQKKETPQQKPKEKVVIVEHLTPKNKDYVKTTPTTTPRQRHICGLCGIELFSKEDAEAHVKSHKVKEPELQHPPTSIINQSSTPVLKAKPKLMRCKRCQAVVESQHVKQHICFTATYPCKTCDLNFGSEKLLADHSLLHAKSQKSKKVSSQPQPQQNHPPSPEKPAAIMSRSNSNSSDKNFTCFLCDKRINGEETMKDHLQYHCQSDAAQAAVQEHNQQQQQQKHSIADNPDENPSPEEEARYQCAICGERCDSEESLESHVIEHLEEKEAEEQQHVKPGATAAIGSDNALLTYACPQCPETFDSSLLLAMHLTTHQEEEEAEGDEEMEEDEDRRSIDEQNEDYPEEEVDREIMDDDDAYVCAICDEIFDTPEELASHTDLHKGKTHVCILCEKSFLSILDLREHVSSHLQKKC